MPGETYKIGEYYPYQLLEDKSPDELPQWHVPTTREEAIQVLEDAVWRLEHFSCHYKENFYPEQIKAILKYLKDEQ